MGKVRRCVCRKSFDAQSVYVNKIGNVVMMVTIDNPWQNMVDACNEFSDDVLSERNQPQLQERDWLE